MTKDTPEELTSFHERRQIAFKRNEWGEVVKICERILELKTRDPLACHDLCVAHWRRGDREQARRWANKTSEAFIADQSSTPIENQMRHMMTLMKVGKASARYLRHYEVLGEILYEEGAFEAARDFFEQLTQIKGSFSRKYIYIFKCDLHLRQFDVALKQYSRMAHEFPGREGHLIVSFKDYLTRHLDDNEAMDLYVRLLDESGMREKELQRLKSVLQSDSQNEEAQSFLRAHARFNADVTGELQAVKQALKENPDSVQLLIDFARLSVTENVDQGVKALIRALQLSPDHLDHCRDVIREYFSSSVQKEIQENLCKGILAVLDDQLARGLLLDLAAELKDNELLKDLQAQWGAVTDSFKGVSGGVTMMLENLSLADLVKAKMRMEEHIETKKGETTFLTLDVVGSTRLKEGVSPERVMVSFASFHKLVDRIVKSQGGKSFIDEGDCKISRYTRAIDGIRAARDIIEKLKEFNTSENKLGSDMTVRIGLHTGLSLIDENMKQERVADHVLDVACHLEKYGVPGEIHISEQTMKAAALSESETQKLGFREKTGVMVYKLVLSN